MNLTFAQFLEQRDPELYNDMLNEGVFDFIKSGVTGVYKSLLGTYKSLKTSLSKALESMQNLTPEELLMKQVKDNGILIDDARNTMEELKKQNFWQQNPQELDDLQKKVSSLIEDNLDKLKEKAKIEKDAEEYKVIRNVYDNFMKVVRTASLAGCLTAGLVGLLRNPAYDEVGKYDATYKGSTSGYVKPTEPEKVSPILADTEADTKADTKHDDIRADDKDYQIMKGRGRGIIQNIKNRRAAGEGIGQTNGPVKRALKNIKDRRAAGEGIFRKR